MSYINKISIRDDLNETIQRLASIGGGALYLDSGTYHMTEDVVIPDNVYISGITRDATIIDFDGGAFSMKINGSHNVKVENLTIQNSSTTAIDFNNVSQSFLTNCYINNSAIGINAKDCDTIVISDCTTDGNDTNLYFDTVTGWTIYDSSFDSSTNDSIVLLDSGNAVFIDNLVDFSGGSGMSLTDCENINISLSSINDNSVNGILLVSGNSKINFAESAYFNNTVNGINIGAANTDNLIIGNTLYTNGTAVSDSGTGTLIRSNIGIFDN